MSSIENELRVLKRKGRKYFTKLVEVFDEYEDDYVFEAISHPDLHRICYLGKILGHIPMKRESEMLRQIMSKTGLGEKDIKAHKKYRILLSEVAKNKPRVISDAQKIFFKVCRETMKELKLPIWNPLIEKEIRNKIKGKSEIEFFCKNMVSEYMKISSLKKQK